MNLRHGVRRWVAAGLLAGLGLSWQGFLSAQTVTTLPPISSLPATQSSSIGTALRKAAPPAETVNSPAVSTPGIISSPPPLNLPAGPALAAPVAVPSDGLVGPVVSGPVVNHAPTATNCATCAAPAAPATLRFANLPVTTPFPRPGYFPIPPSGPGYYTALDAITGNERQGPPKYPYPAFGIIPFSNFDVNWRYLDDPNNQEHDCFDCLKRQRFGPDDMFMATFGGEFRARYNHEDNSRLQNNAAPPPPLRFRGADNDYDLYRTRLYGDFQITERLRIFAEFISAITPDYYFPPLAIDRNWADMLNLFADVMLFQEGPESAFVRIGRQELLYGSQRLISPLDWANTRRTFQGVKAFYRSEQNDFDMFLVQPVVPTYNAFDPVNNNQVFAGAWYTHRPTKTSLIDLYYLFLDDVNRSYPGKIPRRGLPAIMGAGNVHTVGSRYAGAAGNFLWDFEGMLQTGESANQKLYAGAGTAGVGYSFKEAPATPVVWLYYDYASGDDNPGRGNTNQTFNQLFPFGHYYFGFIDVVGRRNIQDISAYLTLWPQNWINTQLQCHNFWLASRNDALYNAGGNAIRRDPTGRAGAFVGTEFDFLVNFHLSNHSDFLVSLSYMNAGSFIKGTAATPSGREDPTALYFQYSYRW